jgi:peroxiredoxin
MTSDSITGKSKANFRPWAASGVSLAIAVFVLMKFSFAAQDGLMWKKVSDMGVVDPSFEVRDATRAKSIADFTLSDRFGNPVSLKQFDAADLLVVNIWSSDCPPCLEEMPSLAEMDHRLTTVGKVALITITIDEGWENVAGMFPAGTDLRVLFDPEKKVTQGIFGTEKFPETFVLDKQRRIRVRFDGKRNWHSPLILDYIKSFI